MRRPSLPRPRLPKRRVKPEPATGEADGPGAGARAGRVLRSAANALQNLLHVLGRVPSAVGRGLRGFWLAMTVRTRRRLALAVLGAIAVALFGALAVPALPCQFPAGDVCPPADDAEEIVPADALAYIHLDLDPEGDQYENAAATAGELPGLSQQIIGRLLSQLPGPGGEPANFNRDVAPWFGGQAAVAIVPRGGAAQQVQLLEEGDADGAAEFAERIAAGDPVTAEYEGVEVSTDDRGLATASVGGFLVIGTEVGVRSVIDVVQAVEDARPLAEDEVATAVRDELPPERFATAYVSEDGIEQLIASPASALSSLEPFVDSTASQAAAASLGAGEDSLELSLRSSLDSERAKTSPGFFAAFPAFEPGLPERLATDTLAYMGIADPGTTVSELLAQATAEAPALAEGFAAAAERLQDLGRVDISKQLLPALGGEAAIALAPGPEDAAAAPQGETTAPPEVPEGLPSGPAPLPAGESSVPILQFLADDVDTDSAQEALARLQGPISKALDTGTTLQAPVFDRREVDGVDVQVLRLGPTLNLAYALDEGSLAVASQPAGVERVIEGDGGLDEAGSFQAATEELASGDEVSMLAYLDLGGLIKLGEREGLAESPSYAAYAQDFRRLDALGLSVEAEPAAIATDLRLVIGPEEAGSDDEGEPPAD